MGEFTDAAFVSFTIYCTLLTYSLRFRVLVSKEIVDTGKSTPHNGTHTHTTRLVGRQKYAFAGIGASISWRSDRIRVQYKHWTLP
jgi:hypothetical protein